MERSRIGRRLIALTRGKLERLQKMIFSLQPPRAWTIDGFNSDQFWQGFSLPGLGHPGLSLPGPRPGAFSAMIVCSCNVFTDHDVRSALSSGESVPRTTGQVYHCLGCSAQCGRCARTIRRIMDEALAVSGVTSPSACCRNVEAGS